MKLFNPPELPELLIRCFIKDKQTKHVYKMSFIDTNLANCYNLIKEATKGTVNVRKRNVRFGKLKKNKFGF